MTKTSMIIKGIVIVMILSFILTSCSSVATDSSRLGTGIFVNLPEEDNENKGFDMHIDNGSLRLSVNSATAEIAVEDLASGVKWYSNPQDWDEDTIASGDNKNILNSQIIISTYNDKNQRSIYNSFKDSVSNNNFLCEQLDDNSFAVTYQFGNIQINYELPKALTVDRYEELYNRIKDTIDQTTFKRRYGKVSLSAFRDTQQRAEYLKLYPLLEEEDLYILRSGNRVIFDQYRELLKRIGYTNEDLLLDNERSQIIEDESTLARYQVRVEYRIDGNALNVNIPIEGIAVPQGFILDEISVLPYFGAEGTESNGYMVFPDGSGSIIYFNNDKLNANPYHAQVYGRNISINEREASLYTRQTYLPVYAVSGNNSSFVASVESGDESSFMNAYVSGMRSSYNYAYYSFEIIQSMSFPLSETSTINFFDNKYIDSDLTIRYELIPEKKNYSELAHAYRRYLIDSDMLKETASNNNNTVYLDLTGGVTEKKSFLGVKYDKLLPLTTFERAREILEEIRAAGLDDINVKYNGWQKDGVMSGLAGSFSPADGLGGKKGLNDLKSYVEKENINLYLDSDIQFMYKRNSLFDGLIKRRYTSRTIVQEFAYRIYSYNPATRLPTKLAHIVKPSVYVSVMDDIINNYSKNSIDRLSLSHLGTALPSDFSKSKYVSREKTKDIIVNELEKASSLLDIMLNGSNMYVLKYSSKVLGLPTSSAQYSITDEEVPFLQLVISGCVDYTGEAYNYDDPQLNFLKAIETGSSLYGRFIYEETDILKEIDGFKDYYTSTFRVWKDKFINHTAELNYIYSKVGGNHLRNHHIIENGIIKSSYDMGSIIINYTSLPFEYDNEVIESMSYLIIEE